MAEATKKNLRLAGGGGRGRQLPARLLCTCAALATLVLLLCGLGKPWTIHAGSGPAGGGAPVAGGTYRPLPAMPSRADLGAFLEADGLRTGAELGVQRGEFAAHTLSTWPSCTKYYLVDLWAHQDNYHDIANVDNAEQNAILNEAKANLKDWQAKTVFLRNYTSNAAALIPDASLDYIYVDARHDYCGVTEDLQLYWPKLKPGGIFAGHDYVTAQDPVVLETGQDWSVCMDGTVHQGAVRGAVDEFAAAHGLLLMTTTQDGGWETWITRKPSTP